MAARIQLDHADALAARGAPGDAARARELAHEAASAAAALGMARLAARARPLLA
jgi:hypothetical protein